MKIRIEISSLAVKSPSGVGNYTKLLTEALAANHNTVGSYFNFLNRQVEPKINIKSKEKNKLFPLRIYAKLQSYNIAPPFDLFKKRVDLTIFPNFATWPTIKSKINACVVHDLTFLYYPEAVEEKNLAHLKRVVPRSIKKADFIITVSNAIKAEIVKEFKIKPENIVVTPIPPTNKNFQENNYEIHKRYNIPTEKFIFFIGNLEPRKDLPTLIEAYRKLPEAIKREYSLVIAGGNGWKTEKSEASLKAAKEANENIIAIGPIDHSITPAFYQKATMLVMPSLYEGFGMPILEAMVNHCPVIASDIPVLRETGSDAAIYAKQGNVDDFCSKITYLIKHPEFRVELNKKAAVRLSKVSWEQNAQNIIDHTNKLLKK